MRRRRIVIAVLLLCGFAGSHAAAEEAIGAVSRIQGEARGVRSGAPQPLSLNTSIFANEVVSTGEAARLEITLTDNSRLTLGENAELTLDTYVFDPAASRGAIRFRVTGALRFVSGQLTKLRTSSVRVTTPVAVIGVRGTDFFAGPIDNQALGVLLFEGSVSVSNAAGQRILRQRGQGTNIAAPGAAPGPVTLWPQAKVDRALAAVTFR